MRKMKAGEVTKSMLEKPAVGFPFVFERITPRLQRLLEEAGYQRCNFNLALSASLKELPAQMRASSISTKAKEIVAGMGEAILLEHITILMNPAYKLDVIKLFCELARTKKLAFLWPGAMEANTLTYAQPGDPDHVRYELSNYDIVLIR